MMNVKGYKVFNPDWTCRNVRYEIGKTYEEDVTPRCSDRGFHFCKELKDCFSYYIFDPQNKVAEVIALGKIDVGDYDSKCCTNKIQIVKELSWEEVLKMVNTGKGNTGLCNIGNRNIGNRNNGDRNIGNRNSGDYNIGDRNSGDWNIGDRNKTNFSSGCFNTEEKMVMFNKPSNWSYNDWLISDARYLLNESPMDVLEWISSIEMTDEEKQQHPEHEAMDGYLKILNEKDCGQIWWDGLSEQDKNTIKGLPNFNVDIFKEITGIDVSKNRLNPKRG